MRSDLTTSRRPVVAGVKRLQPSVLRYAFAEARRRDTYVRVAHVIPRAELGRLNGAPPPLLAQLQRFAAGEPDPPRIDYLDWWGEPADVLTVESREASLLVVGGDELPWISRIAGGEVARKVSLTAPCAVVVVPSADLNPDRTGGVVVAVDGAGPVDGPLLFAFQEAHLRGESLQIIAAAGTPWNDSGRDVRAQRLGQGVERCQGTYPEVEVLPVVPADTGVAACLTATQHASLLVLGRPINDHAPWSPLGVAGRVLRRAKSPVAVVPLDHAIAAQGAA